MSVKTILLPRLFLTPTGCRSILWNMYERGYSQVPEWSFSTDAFQVLPRVSSGNEHYRRYIGPLVSGRRIIEFLNSSCCL